MTKSMYTPTRKLPYRNNAADGHASAEASPVTRNDIHPVATRTPTCSRSSRTQSRWWRIRSTRGPGPRSDTQRPSRPSGRCPDIRSCSRAASYNATCSSNRRSNWSTSLCRITGTARSKSSGKSRAKVADTTQYAGLARSAATAPAATASRTNAQRSAADGSGEARFVAAAPPLPEAGAWVGAGSTAADAWLSAAGLPLLLSAGGITDRWLLPPPRRAPAGAMASAVSPTSQPGPVTTPAAATVLLVGNTKPLGTMASFECRSDAPSPAMPLVPLKPRQDVGAAGALARPPAAVLLAPSCWSSASAAATAANMSGSACSLRDRW